MADLSAIQKELRALARLHRQAEQENDVFSSLFSEPTTTWDDVEQARKTLQKTVPGFYVWYLDKEKGYCLFPKESE